MENQHVLACGVSRFPNEEAKKKFPQNYLKGAQKNNGVLQLVIRNAPEWCSIPPPITSGIHVEIQWGLTEGSRWAAPSSARPTHFACGSHPWPHTGTPPECVCTATKEHSRVITVMACVTMKGTRDGHDREVERLCTRGLDVFAKCGTTLLELKCSVVASCIKCGRKQSVT